MLRPLWTVYLIGYLVFTLPFAGFSLVYIAGMILPGILFAAWQIFEAAQAGGEFTTYYRVMGRFYIQCWAMALLPCAVIANYGPEWVWISAATMLIVPTIIWVWMYYWTNIWTMLLDKETYDAYRRSGRDAWTTEHDLNMDDPSTLR